MVLQVLDDQNKGQLLLKCAFLPEPFHSGLHVGKDVLCSVIVSNMGASVSDINAWGVAAEPVW